jgi:preprotein translocase subunit SecD
MLTTSDLLLPVVNGNAKSRRYVLGPAQLTSSAIKSATAVKESLGAWVVNFRLTPAGSKLWDAFAKRQFHAMIAIVANREVYSAPLIQPDSTRFTSFGGAGEVSGSFTKTEAMDLAKWMAPKN